MGGEKDEIELKYERTDDGDYREYGARVGHRTAVLEPRVFSVSVLVATHLSLSPIRSGGS
jgi:hypothetical protein